MTREMMIHELMEKDLEVEVVRVFHEGGEYSFDSLGEDCHSILIGEFGDEEYDYDLLDYILP